MAKVAHTPPLLLLLSGAAIVWPATGLDQATPPSASQSTTTGEPKTNVLLELQKPIARELRGGEGHTYQLTLDAGQFARGVVQQRGINLFVNLYAPDGRKLAQLDSPIGPNGPEPISVLADAPGIYRVEVRPWHDAAPGGRYEIVIDELRAGTNEDTRRVAAERAFAEASVVTGGGTAESLRNGISKFEDALRLWEGLDDRRQQVFTLTVIGHLHANLADYRKALEYYDRALPLSRAAGDGHGEAMALYSTGLTRSALGDHDLTLAAYTEALRIFRAEKDRSMEAATLGNIGGVYINRGEHQRALQHYNEALVIKQEVGDHSAQATILNNIGFIHSETAEPQKALEFFDKSLPLYRALGDRRGEATTLNNIGKVYEVLGETQRALDFYLEVAQIKRATGNKAEEGVALGNVGSAYSILGDHHKALEFYQQALLLNVATGARSSEAVTLSNIGKAHADLGDHRQALDFYTRALALQREIGDRRAEATTLTNIGRAHDNLGDKQKAMDIWSEALPLRRAVGDRSGEAVTLYNLARTLRDLGDLDRARTQAEAALSIVESVRTKVASQGLRTSYLATTQRYYELGIDVLMRLHHERPSKGFAELALEASERGRARSLLELLSEARADIRQGVPADLIARERSVQRSLDASAGAQMRLLAGKHTADQAAQAAKEIERLTTEYEEIKARIRQSSPRYAALTHPLPLTSKEIQRRLLDDETLLLEYALGDERSFLWAVTTDSLRAFVLPGRTEIEDAGRRVYDVISAGHKTAANESPEQRRNRLARVDGDFSAAAAALSELLLRPVAPLLRSRRLVIVGDGVLQYIPFAALPIPAMKAESQHTVADTPLIAAHEVVTLPSASVLAALRHDAPDRKAAQKTIAVFADPVFHADDSRVKAPGRVTRAQPQAQASVMRSAEESGVANLVRLRFSRREADRITRLVADDRKLLATDFSASRATVTSAPLGDFAIVHFATHGLINSRHPELSGIVLSLVDEQGRAQDGFFRLHEIYNLRLDADLVVLSACQTALGKQVKGEGLLGLTRGFMYAGAPRVVASLWQVDDQATAELMTRFYEGMLRDRLRPAEALRRAQTGMSKDDRWRAPHYWAAFTLQGEWR